MKNKVDIYGDVAVVYVSSYLVLMDTADLHFIERRKVGLNGSTRHDYPSIYCEGKSLKLHRVIMEAKPGMMVDHISGDRFDCRRSNLRFCTRSQNGANRKPGRYGLLGVDWHKKSCKWRARIKGRHIGYYDTEKEATAAYQKAAVAIHGEFASWYLDALVEEK